VRFALPLVALCALSSVPLRASDIFDITLTGTLSGNGTFTTDGTCEICEPYGAGLLSLTIDIGRNSGPNAFDLIDDSLAAAAYIRSENSLTYAAINSETDDIFDMTVSLWSLTRVGMVDSGTFSVTEVPEPSSLFLLMPGVALVGLRLRHQRLRRSAPALLR
jgi:hypothetical protein